MRFASSASPSRTGRSWRAAEHPEVEVGLRLRAFASTVGGREQMAVEAFASALDIIPRTLAENARPGPHRHAGRAAQQARGKDGKNFGLNVYEGKPVDMLKQGVIEPLRVKTQVINSATEAAVMILRIDDVIASGGPSEQEMAAGTGSGAAVAGPHARRRHGRHGRHGRHP